MSNYPDGAANDPNAPWNRDNEKWTEWESSHVCHCVVCEKERYVNENGVCEECFEPEEIKDEE
jgi:hypothetical protein